MNRQQAIAFLADNGAVPPSATPTQKSALVDGVLAYQHGLPNERRQDEYGQFFQAGWMEAQGSLDVHATSPEILSAIKWLARDSAEEHRIWQDPTEEEVLAIFERVTQNGLIPATEFVWGESDNQWAS